MKAILVLRKATNEVGLQSNLSESSTQVPKWANSSTLCIQEHHVLHTNNTGVYNMELEDKITITFAKDGICCFKISLNSTST